MNDVNKIIDCKKIVANLNLHYLHSVLMRIQTKVSKTDIGCSQGDKVSSRDLKSAFLKILQYKENFCNILCCGNLAFLDSNIPNIHNGI